MPTSTLSRSLGARLFWLGFGLLIGLPQFLDGLSYDLLGELFFGLGMLLFAVRGFISPVPIGKRMSEQERAAYAADTRLGPPKLVGALSVAMLVFVTVGLLIKLANWL